MKFLRRRRRVWNRALNRDTQHQWQSQALIPTKRLRKIRKFSEPGLAPPAAGSVQPPLNDIHHRQAEELAWGLGTDSPAGRIWALAGKERPQRRLPPPAAA